MRVITATCLTICLLVLLGCSSQESSQSSQNSSSDSINTPDSEFFGTKIILSEGGRVTTEILSERIVEFVKLDSSMSYGVHVTTYDSLGGPAGWVIADSAIIRKKTGQHDLFGNVVLVNHRQTRLKTNYLHWNSETDRVETDEYFDIKRGDDWMTGWDLEADINLNWYSVKKVDKVNGNLQNLGQFKDQ